MDLAPRHAGCHTDHPTPMLPRHQGCQVDNRDVPLSTTGTGKSQDHQPIERIHKMRWSNRSEREDAAKHLHTKLLQVESMYQQCQQALQELQQEKQQQQQSSLAQSNLNRSSSSGPLPLKSKLAAILDGINELKKQEFDGVFGWRGAPILTQTLASDEAAIHNALQECQSMEARIMGYEHAILREHSDEIHHSGEKSMSTGDQKQMEI